MNDWCGLLIHDNKSCMIHLRHVRIRTWELRADAGACTCRCLGLAERFGLSFVFDIVSQSHFLFPEFRLRLLGPVEWRCH